jgi:hypothetical protein
VHVESNGWIAVDATAQFGIAAFTYTWDPVNIFESTHVSLLDKCVAF